MTPRSFSERSVSAVCTLPPERARELIDKLARSVICTQRIGQKEAVYGRTAFAAAGEAALAKYFGDPVRYPTGFSYPCSPEEKVAFYDKCDKLCADEAQTLTDELVQGLVHQAVYQFITNVELHDSLENRIYVARMADQMAIEILRSETLSLKVETLHPGMTINFRERDATASRTCIVLSIHHAPTLGRIFMVSFNPAEAPVPLLEDNMKDLIARKI